MSDKVVESMQDILEGSTTPLGESLEEAQSAVAFAKAAKDVYELQREALALELEARGIEQEHEQVREKEAPEQDVEMEHDLEL